MEMHNHLTRSEQMSDKYCLCSDICGYQENHSLQCCQLYLGMYIFSVKLWENNFMIWLFSVRTHIYPPIVAFLQRTETQRYCCVAFACKQQNFIICTTMGLFHTRKREGFIVYVTITTTREKTFVIYTISRAYSLCIILLVSAKILLVLHSIHVNYIHKLREQISLHQILGQIALLLVSGLTNQSRDAMGFYEAFFFQFCLNVVVNLSICLRHTNTHDLVHTHYELGRIQFYPM